MQDILKAACEQNKIDFSLNYKKVFYFKEHKKKRRRREKNIIIAA